MCCRPWKYYEVNTCYTTEIWINTKVKYIPVYSNVYIYIFYIEMKDIFLKKRDSTGPDCNTHYNSSIKSFSKNTT